MATSCTYDSIFCLTSSLLVFRCAAWLKACANAQQVVELLQQLCVELEPVVVGHACEHKLAHALIVFLNSLYAHLKAVEMFLCCQRFQCFQSF